MLICGNADRGARCLDRHQSMETSGLDYKPDMASVCFASIGACQNVGARNSVESRSQSLEVEIVRALPKGSWGGGCRVIGLSVAQKSSNVDA